MVVTFDTSSRSFRHIFSIALFIFSIALFGVASYSWTGPTGTAPANNVSAPVNVGTDSQVKSGALSVNGLSVYGSQYIQDYLGVGASASAPWRVYAPGSSYGVYGEATTGQAIRGYASGTGYGGYFVGYGGVYAQNSSNYYAFLAYPGSSWSVYANGPTYTSSYSRADGGFCIGGSCKTSWGAMGSSYWADWVSEGYVSSCASGYIMTGFQTKSQDHIPRHRALCASLAP